MPGSILQYYNIMCVLFVYTSRRITVLMSNNNKITSILFQNNKIYIHLKLIPP